MPDFPELPRLDAELVRRGLARSRALAVEAVAGGRVTVDGKAALKASLRISPDAELGLVGDDGYVSRSAHKLAAAFDAFDVTVRGRLALDVGASTGGFTQVLLERGAREVIALDVGHAQLAPLVREDPRVRVVEGVNARSLTAEGLAREAGTESRPELVVADVSFISLTTILPALRDTADPDADFVLLIKPQFEVGRTGIREGLVRDRARRQDAASAVLWAAWDLGLPTAGIISSPLPGSSGNQEYLVWFSRAVGGNPTEWAGAVAALL
ncbi:TlyA family RNA methyltransferase [Lysinimonas soli]|uniref:TlyA family RNA methyltransferase n=1 Tax=Lysinimonas soli TaxID=1074233 RepID=A0ABW0NN65_9MICO